MQKGNFIAALICTAALGVGNFFWCILDLKIGNKKQAKLDLIGVILAALSWFYLCVKYYQSI